MMSLLSSFGPIGLMFLATAWLLKVMVADKLKTLQKSLDVLTKGQANHADRITAMETAMRINGCLDPNAKPRCSQ